MNAQTAARTLADDPATQGAIESDLVRHELSEAECEVVCGKTEAQLEGVTSAGGRLDNRAILAAVRRAIDDVDAIRSANKAETPAAWEAPIPLSVVRDVPSFPTEHLPVWLGEAIDATAIATQTPTMLPALVALSSVALAVAGTIEVEVREGWKETLALYSLLALPPSNRKSAVFEHLTRPLHEWERERAEASRPENESRRQRRKVAEQTLEKKRQDAVKAIGSDREAALADVDQLAREVAEMPEPTEPRLLVSDATPERIAVLLSENDGRLGVLCPEGSAFLRILGGAYTKDGKANLSVILSGYSGDFLRVDRQSRPSVHVPRPVLVLNLLVQEQVLANLREQPDFIGQGLLSRFILARPPSLIGSRVADAPSIPSGIASQYRDNLRRLLNTTPAQNERGEHVSRILHLSKGARGLLYALHDRLEPRLGPGGDLERDAHWAGKLVGLCARLAALLHLADRAQESEPWASPVTDDTMRRAIHYGEGVFLPHALAALELIDQPPEARLAEDILARIRRDRLHVASRADLWRSMRKRRAVVRPEDLERPLAVLEECHYLRREHVEREKKAGRPPGPTYAVNPAVHAERVSP